jgi:hypothetical protein
MKKDEKSAKKYISVSDDVKLGKNVKLANFIYYDQPYNICY